MTEISSQELLQLVMDDNLDLLADRVDQLPPYSWDLCAPSIIYAIEQDRYRVCQILASKLARGQYPSNIYGPIDLPRRVINLVVTKELKYWLLLEAFLVPWISYTSITSSKQSLEMTRHFQERGFLTEQSWNAIIFFQIHDDETLQQLWAIRLAPSGIMTDYDRKWLQRQAIDTVNGVEVLGNIPERIEQIRKLYPEVITDCLDQFLHAIFFPADETSVCGDMVTWVLDDQSVDSQDWLCQMMPRILTSLGSRHEVWPHIARATTTFQRSPCGTYPVQYHLDPIDRCFFIVSEYPLDQSVIGWTTFVANGYYLYSTTIYLDRDRSLLLRAEKRSAVVPISDDPISPPEGTESPITIGYGPDYSNQMQVLLPAFMTKWRHATSSRAKSARSVLE